MINDTSNNVAIKENTREPINKYDISSFTLHILAMILMLGDHIWGTGVLPYDWLTWLGRMAFPIFAFMIVEGYCRTGNLKRYVRRLLLFAVISEIPFNLMMAGIVIYPFAQNVLWTFLISIGCLKVIHRAKYPSEPCSVGKRIVLGLVAIMAVMAGYVGSILAMTDYNAAGVLTVILFYVFRGNKWYHRVAQLLGMYWINCEFLGGLVIPTNIFGLSIEIPQQGFALFALIPIWLYRGNKGLHNRWIQYAFYAFYPVHILILALISLT